MFKKMITLMMVMSIFTVNAYATTNAGLKTAFDELNYTLTVETDGSNEAVKKAAVQKFSAAVRDLKVSNTELVEFVKSEVKDAKIARDLETAFSMISINNMSQAEAVNYMSETMKKSYSTGASWNGDSMLWLGVLVVVVIVVAAASAGGSSSGSYTGGGYCNEYYACDTYCSYDPYWGYSCYDSCGYYCY